MTKVTWKMPEQRFKSILCIFIWHSIFIMLMKYLIFHCHLFSQEVKPFLSNIEMGSVVLPPLRWHFTHYNLKGKKNCSESLLMLWTFLWKRKTLAWVGSICICLFLFTWFQPCIYFFLSTLFEYFSFLFS